MTLSGRKRRFFSAFGICIFGSFRLLIQHTQYYLVPHWLSIDPKTMTLNDRKWPFYVCGDDHFAYFADE